MSPFKSDERLFEQPSLHHFTQVRRTHVTREDNLSQGQGEGELGSGLHSPQTAPSHEKRSKSASTINWHGRAARPSTLPGLPPRTKLGCKLTAITSVDKICSIPSATGRWSRRRMPSFTETTRRLLEGRRWKGLRISLGASALITTACCLTAC